MKKKTLGLIALFLVTAPTMDAVAQDNEFATRKQEWIQELDTHISALQNAKACAASAPNRDAMKKCREDLEKARGSWRAQHQERRKQQIDERIKKLQEEKAKIDQQKPGQGK